MKTLASVLVLLMALLTAGSAWGQSPLELATPTPNAAGARDSMTPVLNPTRRVLYFVDRDLVGGPRGLVFAFRPQGLVGPWGPRSPLAAGLVGSEQVDPAPLPDGQGLVFAAAQTAAGSGFKLQLIAGDATEPATTTWTSPQALTGLGGSPASSDRGATILRTPTNTLVGDLFFASDRGGAFEIYWAAHAGLPGFQASSWSAPVALNLRARIPGATAVGSPKVSLLADGKVALYFNATVNGVEGPWRSSVASANPFFLGNPAAWSTPTPYLITGASSPAGAFVDDEAGLVYFDQDVAGERRLFVTGTAVDQFPLLLANDTVAAGQNSRFVLIGRPNAYFALVSDFFAIDLAVPPYGRLGVLYPPSPSAFVFDGTGVFPGQNYLPLPLMTDASGQFHGDLGPIPTFLVGQVLHSQAFLYDHLIGDWRLSDDGDPDNDSAASRTTITGGGALVQLRSVTLCDANLVDDALGSVPFVEPSDCFHDLDDPWLSVTCRVTDALPRQGRVVYDILDQGGAVLVAGLISPPFAMPADARDHDYRFAIASGPYQAACPPGARYGLRASLELESAPGVWVAEGPPVLDDFQVTTRRPVLLVHGLGGDETSFGELAAILEDEPTLGYPVRRFLYTAAAVNALPGQDALDSKAMGLAAFVADTGYADYTIVAHSLGGLVARRFLAEQPMAGGDRRLVLLGVPNFGARAAFLFDPVYTAPATTSIVSAFVPPMTAAIREELTPGSDFLDDLGLDWGQVAPTIPVLNVVGYAGLDFDFILSILGLPVPAGILADFAGNDGLVHGDEATLPQALPGGPINPINVYVEEAHNLELAEAHAIFGAPAPAMARFGRDEFGGGRVSLQMLVAFHQAVTDPLAIGNPLAQPPLSLATGSLIIPTGFVGPAFDDYCASNGFCFRNQQTDRLLWTGLPLPAPGTNEGLAAVANLPPGSPCVPALLAPAGLPRLPETRLCLPIVFPAAGSSLSLAPATSWPY